MGNASNLRSQGKPQSGKLSIASHSGRNAVPSVCHGDVPVVKAHGAPEKRAQIHRGVKRGEPMSWTHQLWATLAFSVDQGISGTEQPSWGHCEDPVRRQIAKCFTNGKVPKRVTTVPLAVIDSLGREVPSHSPWGCRGGSEVSLDLPATSFLCTMKSWLTALLSS